MAKEIYPLKYELFYSAKSGKLTNIINKALLGKHIQLLYDKRPYNKALILYQLRFGICRLNNYLFEIRATISSDCEYGVIEESVNHFLF